MSSTTSHLGITLVQTAQAQKEVTVNQALITIDALLNTGAKSRATSTPPGSPSTGDLYIVGASPTGAWSGQAGNLTYFNQVWQFITPGSGMRLWVNDENLSYTFNGTSWAANALDTINAQTGTSYTLAASDLGKTVEFNNAATIYVTLPNSLPPGFNCTLVQTGAGQVSLGAASGAAFHNTDGFYRTAGQYAMLNIYVTTNSGGSSAVYLLQGRGV